MDEICCKANTSSLGEMPEIFREVNLISQYQKLKNMKKIRIFMLCAILGLAPITTMKLWAIMLWEDVVDYIENGWTDDNQDNILRYIFPY